MRKDQIFVLLLIFLLPMTGCFGGVVGDSEADSDDDEPQWINDVGISPINWNLSLNQNQWLEVKSSYGLLAMGGDENSSQEEITQYGLIVSEDTGWSVNAGFSPIFGGDYSICGIFVEEIAIQLIQMEIGTFLIGQSFTEFILFELQRAPLYTSLHSIIGN